jgi:hypothetical protein
MAWHRKLLLAAAAAGLCASMPFVLAPADPALANVASRSGDVVDSVRFEDWVPVLREGAEVTFSQRTQREGQEPGQPAPVGQQTTLGPLDEEERRGAVKMLEDLAQCRFEKLHALPVITTPGACHELVVQAGLLADAEEAAAAADALANGSYFTTPLGPLPPAPPDAGIVQFQAKKGGTPVVVSVIVPWAKYARYADAWRYRLEVAAHHAEYVVAEFNNQDLAWRQEAIARREANEALPQKSREYRAFRARWFPRGVHVDAGNALLVPERGLPETR